MRSGIKMDLVTINHKDGSTGAGHFIPASACVMAMDAAQAEWRRDTATRKSSAKLHDDDIPVIRALLADGESYRKIARRYAMEKGAIGAIARGETWRHVA